jgi:hypothetical protein
MLGGVEPHKVLRGFCRLTLMERKQILETLLGSYVHSFHCKINLLCAQYYSSDRWYKDKPPGMPFEGMCSELCRIQSQDTCIYTKYWHPSEQRISFL